MTRNHVPQDMISVVSVISVCLISARIYHTETTESTEMKSLRDFLVQLRPPVSIELLARRVWGLTMTRSLLQTL